MGDYNEYLTEIVDRFWTYRSAWGFRTMVITDSGRS